MNGYLCLLPMITVASDDFTNGRKNQSHVIISYMFAAVLPAQNTKKNLL